jgi:HEAT repeat protein
MPNKLLNSAKVALDGKDFAALKSAMAKAPITSNAQKSDVLEALTFALDFSKKKGRSTVEGTLPVALETIRRVLLKCKSTSAEAGKFTQAKCAWVATASMVVGLSNTTVEENVKEFVKLVESSSDEAKFSPYLKGLCQCISMSPDVLALCAPLEDKLVVLVKEAIRQPDAVQPSRIDAIRIILGFMDQGIMDIKKCSFVFKCLWNPYSYVYAPLRQLHINNNVLLNTIETLMGILREIVQKHADSCKLFSYDSETMCAELPTLSDNSSKPASAKPSTGKDKKKSKAPMMSLAQMQKLKREKQKAKGKGASKAAKKVTTTAAKVEKVAAAKKPMTIRRLGKNDHPLISSLMAYLLEPAVCEFARKTVQTLCLDNETFVGLCISAFRNNLLRQGRAMKGDVRKSPCMKENFLGASTLSRCYKGLPIVNHNNQMFCELMIIGHHPMVTINADKTYARWLDIIGAVLDAVEVAVTPDSVISTLLSEKNGVFSSIVCERMTAQRVVDTFVNHTERIQRPAGFLSVMVPEVVHKLVTLNAELDKLGPKELGVYNTPEGQLYSHVSKQDKSNTGSKHKTADEKWEDQVRREIEEKKAQKLKTAGEKKQDPAVAAMLKEEGVIRENVSKMIYSVHSGLFILRSVCSLNRELLSEHFPAMISVVNSLLNHSELKTLFDGAKETLQALCKCTDEPIGGSFASIASTLYMKSTRKTSLPETATSDFVNVVSDYSSNGNSLTSSAGLIILPILNHIASTYSAGPCRGKALQVIVDGVREDLDASVRASAVSTGLHLLSIAPAMKPAPIELLKKLCSTCCGPLREEFHLLTGNAGILSPNPSVRHGVAAAMSLFPESSACRQSKIFAQSLWLVQFDPVAENMEFAEEVWTDLFGEEDEDALPAEDSFFLSLFSHPERPIQDMAADALAGALGVHAEMVGVTLKKLLDLYECNEEQYIAANKMKEQEETPKFAGLLRKAKEVDPLVAVRAGTRAAVGRVFGAAGDEEVFEHQDVVDAFGFLISKGLRDEHSLVRSAMTTSGMRLVTQYGKEAAEEFLGIFETALVEAEKQEKSKSLSELECLLYDHQREGVIVFMGTIAKHMKPANPKIPNIIEVLLSALNTPSEDVQIAVAGCLPILMKMSKKRPGSDNGEKILKSLLDRALNAESYGERRGASHGLAAVVKGLGIPVLTSFGVITALKEAAANRKSANHRQGALFCFERFCITLGLLFEPFIIQLLENILYLVSDRNPDVSEAAKDATRAVMKKLSAHGVKLVMGPLLNAFAAPKWQSKVASISMLGYMAYCAPKQLASCLPIIMPKLALALADAHPKVRRAGLAALDDVGSVITNPEVSTVAEQLRDALADPPANSEKTLLLLQDMEFVNPIDPPALAMIMPVVLRGMSDRSTKSKSSAAKIVGGMSNMVAEGKTLLPYKDDVLTCLKKTLVDPLPNVRAVAAQSLGELVRGLGEIEFPDLLDWLIATLKSETTTVERSGGAQGLSEVLVALGPEKLENVLMNELLPLEEASEAAIREGMMWTLAFLPPVMGAHFADILEVCLPVVLRSLSDEVEFVRNVALKAGQIIVTQHAMSHTSLLLPVIEKSMFDADWRIRQSAVQLLGDLLFKVAGIRRTGVDKYGNSNAEMEENNENPVEAEDLDDAETENVEYDAESHVGSNKAEKALVKGLGVERHRGVIAALFIARADNSIVVRQAAIQVWKMVVHNTGRTMRQILPSLMDYIVRFLSSEEEDKRYTAGTALGEIVRKLGDRVLPTMVPILKNGLAAEDPVERQGVCRGLVELIGAAGKRNLQSFVTDLISCVKVALCDSDHEVREAAASAFNSLQRQVGQEVTTAIFPPLLKMLQEGDNRALLGIKEILSQKSADLLPYLIPKITSPLPLGKFQAEAITGIAAVSGSALHQYVNTLLPAILSTIVSVGAEDVESKNAFLEAAKTIVISVEDAGVQWTLVELGKQMSNESALWRETSIWLLQQYISNTSTDYSDWLVLILKLVFTAFFDEDKAVLLAANQCLGAMNKAVEVQELLKNLDFIRQHIGSMVSGLKYANGEIKDDVEVPGYAIPKGLVNVVPVYLHGLMYGSTAQRECAADGIGEIVMWSSATTLRPFFVKLTGPLIRVVGDRFPSTVKSAILKTLILLLGKAGARLRAFLPQLQTTFLKNISDSSHIVRRLSVDALSALLPMVTRVEPLVAELLNGLINAELDMVRESYARALANLIKEKKKDISESAIQGIDGFLKNNENDDIAELLNTALNLE